MSRFSREVIAVAVVLVAAVGCASSAPSDGAASSASSAGGTGGEPGFAESVCSGGQYAASPLPEGVLAPTAVCTGFRFTEGAVWFQSQSALFFSNFEESDPTDNHIGDIVKFVPGGDCTTFVTGAGTNGLAIGATGQLLGASHLTQSVSEWDLTTLQSRPLTQDYMGMAYSSPNDLTVHENGTIYFTDPAWQVGTREEVRPQGSYYLPQGGTSVFIEEFRRANGITLSPDQTRLYIAGLAETRVFDLDELGVPSNGRLFVDEGSDGMAVDCAGNLYLTSSGVAVYSPAGELIGRIPTSEGIFGFTANAAFGGSDRRTLYINTPTELLAIELNIPGYPY